jgi:D-alanyl-D-alanine-carboxypeptidase/D-alanyl-D-alanine-endopeptidase
MSDDSTTAGNNTNSLSSPADCDLKIGMNDTRITLPDALKARLAVGHNKTAHEINAPELSEVIAGAGAFHSSPRDLLKYVSANVGLIHTNLDSAMQESHLIIQAAQIKNVSSNYYTYMGLGWHIFTNLGTEIIGHPGGINGYNSFIGFNPTTQIGLVLLCSCENIDVDIENIGLVLLHVLPIQKAGLESLNQTKTAAEIG